VPNPTIREGHFDQLLSNVSVAYIQSSDKFVADKAFPSVPVQKAGDVYLVFPRGYFFRDEVGPRPLGGRPRIAGYKLEEKPYYCEEQALMAMLDERERQNATPPYDPEKNKVRFLTQQHLIHRDRDWANAYMKAGVWSSELTGVAATPGAGEFLQFDQANSTPIELIDEKKDLIAEATGFEPNVLVMGRKVFRVVKNHPDVVDRVKYTARGVVTAELLAELFGVGKVLVPGGVHNAGPETQDGSQDAFEFIVPKTDMLLAYAAEEPGLDQPSAGYIFSWRGLLGAAGFEAAVFRGRDGQAFSDWFAVRMAYDMHVVAPDLGVFFKDAVAA